jgi:hypothetical protein
LSDHAGRVVTPQSLHGYTTCLDRQTGEQFFAGARAPSPEEFIQDRIPFITQSDHEKAADVLSREYDTPAHLAHAIAAAISFERDKGLVWLMSDLDAERRRVETLREALFSAERNFDATAGQTTDELAREACVRYRDEVRAAREVSK